MMKFPRPPQPNFLAENYKAWGHEHKATRDANPRAGFKWKTYNSKKVNKRILQAFGALATRCAFCDGGYPLGTAARQTIEHFRPVSQYPRLAYVWANLFPCCDVCQSSKLAKFERKLLKPDVESYSFERYFMVNYKTGEIEANSLASEYDQERAQFTIQLYGLNKHGRPQSRLMESRKFRTPNDDDDYTIDDFNYRFFLL